MRVLIESHDGVAEVIASHNNSCIRFGFKDGVPRRAFVHAEDGPISAQAFYTFYIRQRTIVLEGEIDNHIKLSDELAKAFAEVGYDAIKYK